MTQLQTVIDNAPISIFVEDRDRRFLAINAKAAESSGGTPEALLGRTVEEFMSAESVAVSRKGDLKVLTTGDPYQGEEALTLSGEEFIMWTTKFPLLGDAGEVYAVCGISLDITAERETERLASELAETQQRSIDDLRTSRRETVDRLARALGLQEPNTGAHVTSMAVIAAFLAHQMGLSHERVQLLRTAAPMHDIGKIATPNSILLKPGPLTDEERTEMERHTTLGHEILAGSDSELLCLAATIALTHHERFDGSGYPRGLEGEEIPLEGRIVAVADVFDALLSGRPYRPGMPLAEAVELIEDGRATQFDPRIADVLLTHLEEAYSLRG